MSIEQKLGYFFFDKAILKRALIRRDYAIEQRQKNQICDDQDAYQMLGSTVIKAVLTELLIRAGYTTCQEISDRRMVLEAEENVGRIAYGLEIDTAIKLSAAEKEARADEEPATLIETLEALIGGVYFDGGFRAARETVVQLFKDAFPEN